MRDMVNLVLVQADSAGQVDLDLVCGSQTTDQVSAGDAKLLRDSDERSDVVTRMGVFRGQKRVVKVEFAHRDAVGPGRPFRRIGTFDAEDPRPLPRRMGQRLLSGHRDRPMQHSRGADGGVVDDAVRHHLRRFRLDGNRIGGDFRNLGGQVFTARQIVGAAPRPHRMHQHNPHTMTRAPRLNRPRNPGEPATEGTASGVVCC